MRAFTGGTFVAAIFLALTGLAPSTAAADPVADFYRGKTISMIIATAPGGDYDLRARLVARHIGRHIPGNPAIVPRNMPGGVGIQAANYMADVAPQDGTSLHAIMQNMSTHQALGGAGVEFDTRKFFWIGNTTDTPNTIISWHTTGIQTIQDVMTRELVVGAPGTATASVYYPKSLNELAGTKFKIVTGYPGGNQVNLAMERGEVGGRDQLLGVVEGDQAGLAAGKEDLRAGADRAQARPRACRRADHDRARQDRRGQGGHDVPVGRHPDQPRLCDDAGRAARACAGAAARLRRHHEGPASSSPRRRSSAWTSARRPARRRRSYSDLIANTPAKVLARAKAIIESK